ncbi:MAG: tripartite tricarboxylate transporter substrate binding protein [Variovorax sp.]
MTRTTRLIRQLLVFAGILLVASPGMAQTYPSRPIKLVVPFAAGGSSDVLGRAVASAMSSGLGQPVVVENRPGAGGQIGAAAVASAPADGYTMLFGTNGILGIGPALYKNLPYSPTKDLAAVGMLHTLANVLIVNSAVPASDVGSLVAYAKAHPGALTYASAGNGSASHLAAEMFKSTEGVDIVHVPYKGGGAAMPDLLAGRVSMMFETMPSALQAMKSAQIRGFAVTTPSRSAVAPQLATLQEAGVAGFDFTSWTGLFVPAATPAAIILRLNAETRRIATDEKYKELLNSVGTDVVTSSPAQLSDYMKNDIARTAKIAKEANISID